MLSMPFTRCEIKINLAVTDSCVFEETQQKDKKNK